MKKTEAAGWSAVNHAILYFITGVAMVWSKRDVAPSASNFGVIQTNTV
jgi:hypothetical protein